MANIGGELLKEEVRWLLFSQLLFTFSQIPLI